MLCVFVAGTPQDKADSALYSARIPEVHRYDGTEKCTIIQTYFCQIILIRVYVQYNKSIISRAKRL